MNFVDPARRRAGIGTQLFEHGMAMAKSEAPDSYIGFSSSPMARTIYEKYGFKVVDWFDITRQDVSETGEIEHVRQLWPFMTNYWEGHEDEVQIAGTRVAFYSKVVTP